MQTVSYPPIASDDNTKCVLSLLFRFEDILQAAAVQDGHHSFPSSQAFDFS
jgi:hypothetical protein